MLDWGFELKDVEGSEALTSITVTLWVGEGGTDEGRGRSGGSAREETRETSRCKPLQNKKRISLSNTKKICWCCFFLNIIIIFNGKYCELLS